MIYLMKDFTKDSPSTTEVILNVVAVAGVISLAVMAPNCVQLLASLVKKKRHQQYYIKYRVKELHKKGWLDVKKDGGEFLVSLAPKGEQELERLKAKHRLDQSKKKWDGKWRVIIFDIKEYKRGLRDWFRVELNECGFIKLQNSVWVTPYDCEDLIALMKTDLGLDREIIYMVVEKIENDKWLRKEFSL